MLLSEVNTHITVLAPFQKQENNLGQYHSSDGRSFGRKLLLILFPPNFLTITQQWEVHRYRGGQRGAYK